MLPSPVKAYGPPPVITVITEEELKKHRQDMRRKWSPKCRQVWKKRRKLDKIIAAERFSLQTLSGLAYRFRHGDHGCRKSLTLALEVMERAVGPNPLAVRNFTELKKLIELHRIVGRPDSPKKIRELKRFLWLRDHLDSSESKPFGSKAEQRTFIARDDIWAYLMTQNRQSNRLSYHLAEAYLDPMSARFEPAAGIEMAEQSWDLKIKVKAAQMLINGEHIAKDNDRAEALLLPATTSSDEARILFLLLVSPKLESSDVTLRDDTANALFQISNGPSSSAEAVRMLLVQYYQDRIHSKSNDASIDSANRLTAIAVRTRSAMVPLTPWIERSLESLDSNRKSAAWNNLSRLVRAGVPSAKVMLEQDIKRTGGVVEFGPMDLTKFFDRPFVNSNDYPSRALREGREGIVSIEILVSPHGRGIDASIIKSSFPDLGAAVVKNSLRRISGLTIPEHPGRYVRVKLPEVQFRISACNDDDELTEKQLDALIVDASCPNSMILH